MNRLLEHAVHASQLFATACRTTAKAMQPGGVRRHQVVMRWLLALALAAVALPAAAQEFSLYDDFTAAAIDPVKWGNASRGRGLETFKLVSGGALVLGNVSYGDTDSDAGRPVGRTGISLEDTGGAGNLLGLGASVTMLSATSQDCPTNPDTGRAQAQVLSLFFNNGASTGAGDATGDVAAGVQLARDANGDDFIEWFVFRCDDFSCDAFTTLDFGSFTTNWSLGVSNFLLVFWDQANDQFVFFADSEVASSAYTEVEAGIPNTDFPHHVLRLRHLAENCNAGPPRATSGFASFDNVFIAVAP